MEGSAPIPMRQYLRHPTDIPLHFQLTDQTASRQQPLRDIGHGGLCFHAREPLPPGTVLSITIAPHGPPFRAEGTVVWCRPADSGHDIGVRFADEETGFAVRMVEQACHIEHYKREVLATEGRRLSGEQAAAEWIERYAEDFPT